MFEAFHRLEIATRATARLGDDLVGMKLAARPFHPEDGPLTDSSAEAGERQALMNLMCGVLGSYKNPQSYRHVGLDAPEARELPDNSRLMCSSAESNLRAKVTDRMDNHER